MVLGIVVSELLGLDCPEEALDHSVVPAVALAAHATDKPRGFNVFLVLITCVLAISVGVMNGNHRVFRRVNSDPQALDTSPGRSTFKSRSPPKRKDFALGKLELVGSQMALPDSA